MAQKKVAPSVGRVQNSELGIDIKRTGGMWSGVKERAQTVNACALIESCISVG